MGVAMLLGSWVMRKSKQLWPNLTSFWLVAVCFGAMCLFDVLLEGIIWLPMGVFEYPGGHWALFPDTYHKYPLNETFTIGSVFTALAAMRYFTNDKGQMVIERGYDQLRDREDEKLALRLAAIAFCQIAMFVGYNIPNTVIGMNSTEWPEDLQERSYFTNYLCGDGTPRSCPGPGVSHQRDGRSVHRERGPDRAAGGRRRASGHAVPPVVPFDVGPPGGSE